MDLTSFKNQYKKIVSKKGQLTTNALYIKKLCRFDKNDSHRDAILCALEKRDVLKDEFSSLLDGKSYDDWKLIRTKVSVLEKKIKKALLEQEKLNKYYDELKGIIKLI